MLLRATPTHPSSNLGSNASRSERDRRIPQAIIVGKGFSDEEVQEMRNIEGLAGKVPWLLPDTGKFTWTMMAKAMATAGTALPVVIAERAANCLKENGLAPGKEIQTAVENPKAQLWYF